MYDRWCSLHFHGFPSLQPVSSLHYMLYRAGSLAPLSRHSCFLFWVQDLAQSGASCEERLQCQTSSWLGSSHSSTSPGNTVKMHQLRETFVQWFPASILSVRLPFYLLHRCLGLNVLRYRDFHWSDQAAGSPGLRLCPCFGAIPQVLPTAVYPFQRSGGNAKCSSYSAFQEVPKPSMWFIKNDCIPGLGEIYLVMTRGDVNWFDRWIPLPLGAVKDSQHSASVPGTPSVRRWCTAHSSTLPFRYIQKHCALKVTVCFISLGMHRRLVNLGPKWFFVITRWIWSACKLPPSL